MKIEDLQLVKRIVEAALMASEKPLAKRAIKDLFDEMEMPDDELFNEALQQLEAECESKGYELKQVASGYRFQVKQDLSRWVSKLWKERAPRYSRALLETLSLIAYRQPITRGEIEDIRGVAVSTQIIKTLLEREWVKVVGHRDVPGRPAIYATTKQFLDYFNLKSLDQLPPLAEIRDINTISREFNIELPLVELESTNDDAAQAENAVSKTDSELTEAEMAIDTPVESESESDDSVAAFEHWVSDSVASEAGDEADDITANETTEQRTAESESATVDEQYGDELEVQMSNKNLDSDSWQV